MVTCSRRGSKGWKKALETLLRRKTIPPTPPPKRRAEKRLGGRSKKTVGVEVTQEAPKGASLPAASNRNLERNNMFYPAKFSPAEEGGFVVTFRDIPEAITQGDNMAENRTQKQGQAD